MKAKVGFFVSFNRRNTSWPNLPIAIACDRSAKNEIAERSAPAAKMNGLPVIAIATAELASASEIRSFNSRSVFAPKVFGRL